MSANIVQTPLAPANAGSRGERINPRDPANPVAPNPVAPNPVAIVLRESSVATIITDPGGVDNPIVFANPAFCQLTGYRPAEVLGRNCRFLQGAATDDTAVARIAAALRARESIEIEIRNYRRNGSQFWNRLLIAPVRSETGALACFFATLIDITAERGAASRALRAALEERKRVTASLDHLQGVEAVCHLAGGIAHSFDSLLGGIRGSLAMLQRGIAVSVRDRSASPRPMQTE
jgi:PAS domain S-box-containing protein